MNKRNVLFIIIHFISFVAFAQTPKEQFVGVLQPYISTKALSGIVTIVAKGDDILDITNLGYQDIAKGKKMKADALFWIASQSKPIAATAVMMMVEQGKLKLDEPVSTYLPELKELKIIRAKNPKEVETTKIPITLRHLLSHTSGMKYLAGVQERTGFIDMLPFNTSLYVTAITPCDFAPGEGYLYSNQGIDIAATIVERVSGLSYPAFLKQYIFDPLGMKSATFWPTKQQLTKLAMPYRLKDGVLEETKINQLQYPLNDKNKRFAAAGGGLFCTPADLVKFYQMIANKGLYKGKRLLSPESVVGMGKKQTNPEIKEWYGLGFGVSGHVMAHAGAYGTNTRVYKDNGYVLMYFVQQDGLPKATEAQNAFFKLAEKVFKVTK